MAIHLRPETEEWIQQAVQGGAYQTADEFVEHAVSLLHEQEAWLAEHRSEIAAAIDAGYAAARRGDLLDADRVRLTMEARKRAARPTDQRRA
jgi:putative addiction module CopG family antidote